MNIVGIIVLVLACCAIVWVFPKLPRVAQIVGAIVIFIAAILVVLSFAGVPVHL